MKKTKFFNKEVAKWLLIDAKDKVMGRLSTRIALVLKGKHKSTYSPNFLCGDKVVVINARHVKISGNKWNQKAYDRYSGYPSGIKEISLRRLMEKNPTRALYLSIKGMLPKNKLGRRMIRFLKIYPDDLHDHFAQNPQKVEI